MYLYISNSFRRRGDPTRFNLWYHSIYLERAQALLYRVPENFLEKAWSIDRFISLSSRGFHLVGTRSSPSLVASGSISRIFRSLSMLASLMSSSDLAIRTCLAVFNLSFTSSSCTGCASALGSFKRRPNEFVGIFKKSDSKVDWLLQMPNDCSVDQGKHDLILVVSASMMELAAYLDQEADEIEFTYPTSDSTGCSGCLSAFTPIWDEDPWLLHSSSSSRSPGQSNSYGSLYSTADAGRLGTDASSNATPSDAWPTRSLLDPLEGRSVSWQQTRKVG